MDSLFAESGVPHRPWTEEAGLCSTCSKAVSCGSGLMEQRMRGRRQRVTEEKARLQDASRRQ